MKPPSIDGADILEAFGVNTEHVASAAVVFKAGKPPTLTLVQLLTSERHIADLGFVTDRYELRRIGDES